MKQFFFDHFAMAVAIFALLSVLFFIAGCAVGIWLGEWMDERIQKKNPPIISFDEFTTVKKVK